MKASELRIGNLVNRLGKQAEITSITITSEGLGLISTRVSGVVTINQIEPIALTEEWLIKFGYEKDEDQFLSGYLDFTKGNEYIRINDNSTFYRDGNLCIGNKKNLIYVHQLQNLYFALTGTELQLQN